MAVWGSDFPDLLDGFVIITACQCQCISHLADASKVKARIGKGVTTQGRELLIIIQTPAVSGVDMNLMTTRLQLSHEQIWTS